MYRKLYVSLTLISALVLLAYIIFSSYKETTPEWKNYQAEYKELFIRKAKDKALREKAEALETGIRQIYLGKLKRVDRCTNCHMGVENPLMADADIPYKQHSGNYLNDHPVDKFGCTVCHDGQGRATNIKEAHAKGRDTHWDSPLIPLKYVQNSCAQCHDFEMLKQKGGEIVAGGEELFREKGCKGCHKLNGAGGILGKALEGVGSQPAVYFPMKHVEGEKTVYSWLKQHFDDPAKIVPGSQMKVDIKDNESDLLTAYMLTLRAEEAPREYRRISYVQTDATGESLYKMYCIGCHTEGADSVYDEALKQTIPAIMNPAFRRTANNRFLKKVIQNGRAGTQMISWKADAAGLTDENINRIARHITDDRPAVDKESASGEIVAKKIAEDLPDDPDNILWNRTTAFRVPLMLISQKTDPNVKALYVETEKSVADPFENYINVKALYNEKDITFLVEWKDATRNVLLSIDTFRDGVALQFPMQSAPEPTYRMGQGEGKASAGMVNIWFWKADVQESINKGAQPIYRTPVENLMAGGFGTLSLKDRESQHVSGKGKWKNGKWSVVFKRTFSIVESSAKFTIGKFTPVSFAVWDGGESNVDGMKAVSVWYYVVPGSP
jgi:DMSO reductase family type II enzyme heme b subunit